MSIKRSDLSFVLDALRVAREHIEDPDTREDYEVVDVLLQAMDAMYTIEDNAREDGVLV